MEYKKFISYNVFGGLFWGAGMTLAGYYLGRLIPDVDKYLLPIIAVIIFASVLPGIIHMREDIKKFARRNKVFAYLLKLKENWLG